MKKKIVRITNREKRRALASSALPAVRQLVRRFDLASVQAAVKSLYAERLAEKELRAAEQKVQTLKRKLGV